MKKKIIEEIDNVVGKANYLGYEVEDRIAFLEAKVSELAVLALKQKDAILELGKVLHQCLEDNKKIYDLLTEEVYDIKQSSDLN